MNMQDRMANNDHLTGSDAVTHLPAENFLESLRTGGSPSSSAVTRNASSPTADTRGVNPALNLSSFTNFVRQGSKRVFGSAWFTRKRTVSLEQLEQGANRHHGSNSFNFGQLEAVHDDNVLQSDFAEDIPCEFDVENGDTSATVKHISGLHQAHFSTDAGTQTSAQILKVGDNQGKSRLKTIILEQSLFTVYKRLFLVSFILNVTALILAVSGHFSYAKSRATLFSVGNILMTVLVRNEVCLRVLFWFAVHLLGYSWVPLRIKTMTTAILQSLGGIHSGCGLSAITWLFYALAQTFQHPQSSSDSILGVACSVLLLLVLSSLAAFPIFRHIHHNLFERMHRFAGWISLALVWVYVVLTTFWDKNTRSYRIAAAGRKRFVEMQSLWLTAAITFMIILPWLFVRKMAVEAVVPPTKLNTLLHFQGGVKAGLLVRISPSPFSEWHPFGIISDGQRQHTVLAGAVGDFTKSLVESPPSDLWVRTFHFAGLPYLTNLYERVLLVATGSGIGVFLSFVLQPTRADVHIIWIAKKIQKSYGDEMWKAIEAVPSKKLTVIDTAVSGRPRTTELVVTKVREWRAQVVIVTSNPSGTNEIVNGIKAVGVPAFGPIWDS